MLLVGQRIVSFMNLYHKVEAAAGVIELMSAVSSSFGGLSGIPSGAASFSGAPTDISAKEAAESAVLYFPRAVASGISNWSTGYAREKRKGKDIQSFLIYIPLTTKNSGGADLAPL